MGPLPGAEAEALKELVAKTKGKWNQASARSVASDAALTMSTLFEKFASWTAHLSEGQRELLFAGSAEKFYRI